MTNRDDTKLSEILIEKVSSYQCLYNPGNVSYKSKRNKKLCWTQIAQECDLDASVAKGKWKSLRDRYVRERKAEKIAEHSGTGAPRKEWPLYRFLSFLDPFLSTLEIQQEDPHGGVKREHEGGSRSPDCVGHFLDMHSYSRPEPRPLAPQPQPQPQPFVYILPAPTTVATPPPPATQPGPAAKRAKLPMEDRPPANTPSTHLEKRFMRYVNQHGLEEAEEYSSDEMFVLSLVPSFNKLTEARKDKLKLDMHKLVYDAVYGST